MGSMLDVMELFHLIQHLLGSKLKIKRAKQKIQKVTIVAFLICLTSIAECTTESNWNMYVGTRLYSPPKISEISTFKFNWSISPEFYISYSSKRIFEKFKLEAAMGISWYSLRYNFELPVPAENEFYGEYEVFDLRENILLSGIQAFRLATVFDLLRNKIDTDNNILAGFIGIETNIILYPFDDRSRLFYKHLNSQLESTLIFSNEIRSRKSRIVTAPCMGIIYQRKIGNRMHGIRMNITLGTQKIGSGRIIISANPYKKDFSYTGKSMFCGIGYSLGIDRVQR